MTLIGNSRIRAVRAVAGYGLLCCVCILGGMACSRADVAPSETKTTPKNVSIDVKPTATETKQADTKSAGKETGKLYIQKRKRPCFIKRGVPPFSDAHADLSGL